MKLQENFADSETFTVVCLGPVPRKMVKFNPRLSQISSTIFSSNDMQFEVTKYC